MSELPSFFSVRAVVDVSFPTPVPRGWEQKGRRPAIVVALPNITGETRFPMVVVVPLTTQLGDWAIQNPTLYPRFQAGVGNLLYDSTALLDQICALDTRRVLRYLGQLTPEEYQPIENGLRAMFGF